MISSTIVNNCNKVVTIEHIVNLQTIKHTTLCTVITVAKSSTCYNGKAMDTTEWQYFTQYYCIFSYQI